MVTPLCVSHFRYTSEREREREGCTAKLTHPHTLAMNRAEQIADGIRKRTQKQVDSVADKTHPICVEIEKKIQEWVDQRMPGDLHAKVMCHPREVRCIIAGVVDLYNEEGFIATSEYAGVGGSDPHFVINVKKKI